MDGFFVELFMEHELKILPVYFNEVKKGNKTFELRKNDRNYSVGDILVLKEWWSDLNIYSGKMVKRRVSYIFYGGSYGLDEGYCILGLENTDDKYTIWSLRTKLAETREVAFRYAMWWLLELKGFEDGMDLKMSTEHTDKIRHMPSRWCKIFANLAEKCKQKMKDFIL